jgi:polysaccharide deacetylase family protein (PEP-CTERM system associated)
VRNIFSVDLEDWYQLICRRLSGKLPGSRADCVDRQLDTLLPLLARHNTKATFFVLGMLARSAPALVKKVAAEGHEIACHGDQHNLVYRMSPKEFEDDTRRAKELLEDIVGVPVRGYRAAEFSVRNSSLWALEVLARLGFAYDSSIFPVRHRRYGIPDFDPRVMRYDLPGGLHLTEIPLTTIAVAGSKLPFAGGGYFRLAPLSTIQGGIARLNRKGMPVVTYFHPYEFDPVDLDIFQLMRPTNWRERLGGMRFNFHQNLGRRGLARKIDRVLSQAEFTTCWEFLNDVELDKSRELLSAAGR